MKNVRHFVSRHFMQVIIAIMTYISMMGGMNLMTVGEDMDETFHRMFLIVSKHICVNGRRLFPSVDLDNGNNSQLVWLQTTTLSRLPKFHQYIFRHHF